MVHSNSPVQTQKASGSEVKVPDRTIFTTPGLPGFTMYNRDQTIKVCFAEHGHLVWVGAWKVGDPIIGKPMKVAVVNKIEDLTPKNAREIVELIESCYLESKSLGPINNMLSDGKLLTDGDKENT